ncbi:hypothetical protein AALT_g12044 [Alternaria alternata]|nr:hypothetical protein AALT_g12044 [Alternaria alternata]
MFSAPDFFKNIESPTLTQLLAQVIIHLYSEEVEKLRKGKAATDKMPTPEHSEPLGIYLPHLPRLPPKGIAATSIACLASVEKFEAFDDSVAAWDPCDLDHGCYKVTKSCFFFYAGRMKRDHRADTMEGCGSKAGPGSRDRDGIPPRPGLREASKVWEAMALPYLPSWREDRRIGTDCNGYKGWTDFIITLVVVNSNSSSLTQIVN